MTGGTSVTPEGTTLSYVCEKIHNSEKFSNKWISLCLNSTCVLFRVVTAWADEIKKNMLYLD